MNYDTILVEDDGPVRVVRLNRPERMNAWNWQMSAELTHVFNSSDEEDGVRAIVVTGAGKAFCAGADLGGGSGTFAGEGNLGGRDELAERFPGPKKAAHQLSTPIIGAINGAAVGAGLTMPIEWDLRVAAEDAKLGFVFNRRGVMPDADLIWLVPKLIGFTQAMDVLLTGRIFSGAEAADLGLVNEAVSRDRVLDRAVEIGYDIAKNTAPVSVAITKRLMYRYLQETSRAAALKDQSRWFAWTGRKPDSREGVMAFVEKREPEWQMSKSQDLPEELR